MSQSEAKNKETRERIIRSIMRECAMRGHAVSGPLATFMVKAVMLDPRNGFSVDRTLTKEEVQKLEELCLDKLMKKCSPSLDTIRMQVYFHMNYTSRREFLEDIHRAALAKLATLSREITDCRAKSREEFHALYDKIVSYVLLRSGLGSPADAATFQEATAALQSIFPRTKLLIFMALSKKDQEEQLAELAMTVTGIRLFNRANKKEDVDVQELMPAALKEALRAAGKEEEEEELRLTRSLAWRYTAALERLTGPDAPPGPPDVPVALLQQALYNVRQHEVFLQMLQADARLCTRHVEVLKAELSTQMKLLKDTVQAKASVPTAVVAPLFKTLSRLWSQLQDEAELLNILGSIGLSLRPFLASQAKLFSEEYLDSLLEGSEVKTDEQRTAASADEAIDPSQFKTQEWLLPETAASFDEVPLQYNGVCGYTLVDRDGLLLPGNPRIGVLKHAEKLYAFSSKEAALKFASDPDGFVAEVEEKAKRSPELIQLLKLDQQFSCVSPYAEMQPGERLPVKSVTKGDVGTQTELHPMETNIDRSYEWNEWELRRKALKLADLRTKATRSMQTDQSHMRRDNVSQTWPPKDGACQTKRDGESGVPRPLTYLAGLRGRRVGQVVKVDLTRPVDEQ